MTSVQIKEFDFEKMISETPSCTWFVIAPPGSGKTTFIENLAYAVKHKYPAARVFAGTQSAYDRFCKIFGNIYTTMHYDEDAEKKHIERQKLCAKENGNKHPSNYAINILDDVCEDPKIFKGKLMNDIFKNGSQHYHQIFIVAVQYAIDIPIALRNTVSYVAIFRVLDEDMLKKLHRNFGGPCGSYKQFTEIMKAITGDYHCLIIDRRSQSPKLEDRIFWYKTWNIEKEVPDWKFGSHAYQVWNKERAITETN
jgi:hypothetical protein